MTYNKNLFSNWHLLFQCYEIIHISSCVAKIFVQLFDHMSPHDVFRVENLSNPKSR